MKVNFLNVKSFVLKHKISKIFNYALKECKIDGKNLFVNVGFVSEIAIQKLNKEYRNVDKITDVLSFPFFNLIPGQEPDYEMFEREKEPNTKLVELGDIAICENVALRQAKQFGHSFKREVCYLATHGLLHILGFDHMTEEEEKNMSALCEKFVSKFGVKR